MYICTYNGIVITTIMIRRDKLTTKSFEGCEDDQNHYSYKYMYY